MHDLSYLTRLNQAVPNTTLSDDFAFHLQIWDLAAKALLFQSAVLSAFSILSLATNPITGDFAIGFADGTVRIFALLESVAKEMAIVRVESFLRKLLWKKQRQEEIQELLQESPNVVSSLPPWARSEESQETAQIQAQVQALSFKSPLPLGYSQVTGGGTAAMVTTNEFKSDVVCPILALSYFCANGSASSGNGDEVGSEPDRRAHFNSHGEQELLGWEQYLVVGTPRHVLYVNAFSLEIAVLQDLQLSTNNEARVTRHNNPVAMAKDFCFYQDGSTATAAETSKATTVACGIVSAFQPCFTVFVSSTGRSASGDQDPLDSSNNNNQSDSDAMASPATTMASRVSVLPTGPPPPDSVLNLPSLAVVAGSKLPKKGAKNLDKPVTFHTRIKSSGYGSAAPFGSKTKRTSIHDRKTLPRSKQPAATDAFLKEYPSQCSLLQHFQQKHALPRNTLHSGAIHHIEFSSDAKWLATCGSDRVAQVCKLPFSRFGGEGNVFAGHDNAVKAIHWSQSNQMVITTSADKSARVWLADSDVASLTFHGLPPVSTSPSTGKQQAMRIKPPSSSSFSSSAKKTAKQEMVDAMFFYMDKFILSGCGNAVRLHQFELDELFARAQKKKASKNDVKVEENKSRKKKVAEWVLDDMQSLTALACVNGSFLSSIVIAAGSDRSLRILDAAVGQTLRVIADAHARAAHTLALPRASCFTSHPSNFYDLLLSSATNSTTHLWDIRADNCVMRFGEHVNHVHQLGVAFSPCMRYVATGSEDRMGYLYDIRTGRCLKKLAGHTDVVTSVAFSPLYPQLATSSYDGAIRFYCDSDGE